MKIEMRNGNICCTEIDEVVEKIGRTYVPTKDKSYKRLQVVTSGDEAVKEGVTIYVPINSGYEVEIDSGKYVIVNVREILLIL